MADDGKPKRAGLGVSTRVENAWYVDPNLLAGEDVDGLHPPMDEYGLPMDSTVNISEQDLEEAHGALADTDEEARHYRDVSLKGALLSPEGTQPEVETLGDRIKDLGDRLSHPDASPRPPPAPGRRSGPAALVDALSTLVREASRLFEPGFAPPFWIAAVAFLLGIGFTLLGVLLAL